MNSLDLFAGWGSGSWSLGATVLIACVGLVVGTIIVLIELIGTTKMYAKGNGATRRGVLKRLGVVACMVLLIVLITNLSNIFYD
jgi:hypothetical protein